MKKFIFWVIFMQNRTDLAVECFEAVNKSNIDGVIVKEENNLTTVEITNTNGMNALGKPIGKYITYDLKSFINDIDILGNRLSDISKIISTLIPENANSVLVAGIGNLDITADALGPRVNDYVLATRHLINKDNDYFKDFFCVSSVATGVLGDTGIESAEIVKGIAEQIKPDCIIAVDALSATSKQRLGTTIQLSNVGIIPGSGVGNHRYEISHGTLGVPVVSIGIPTVLSTAILDDSSDSMMFVTPREIDRIIEQGARLIGMAVNTCLQKNISVQDLLSLVG